MVNAVETTRADPLVDVTRLNSDGFGHGHRQPDRIAPPVKPAALPPAGIIQREKGFAPNNSARFASERSRGPQLLPQPPAHVVPPFKPSLFKPRPAGDRQATSIAGNPEGQLLPKAVFI